MTNVTITRADQEAAALTAKAAAHGLTLADWLRHRVEQPEPAAQALD